MSNYTPPKFQPYGLTTNLINLTEIAQKGTLGDFTNYYDQIIQNDNRIKGNIGKRKTTADEQALGKGDETITYDGNKLDLVGNGLLTTEERAELDRLFEQRKEGPISNIADETLKKLGLDPTDASKTFRDSLYLDHPVAGNILDNFDVSTYKLRLFMKKKDAAAIEQNNLIERQKSQQERENEYGREEFDVKRTTPDPRDIVIIAETGSTDINIDNLSILNFPDKAAQVKFTLTEAGAVTLLDRLSATKSFCGYEATELPLILEIEFKGYVGQDANSNEDGGGSPIVIKGPFFFQLGAVTYTMEITPEGGIYDFTATPNNDIALFDQNYRIPKQLKITGTTLRTLLNDGDGSLQSVWNAKLKENAEKDGTVADEVIINVDNLIQNSASRTPTIDGVHKEVQVTSDEYEGDEHLLQDKLFHSIALKEEFAQRFPGGTFTVGGDEEENQQITDDTGDGPSLELESNPTSVFLNPETTGALAIPRTQGVIINFPEKESFEDILATILSLSEDLFKKATRMTDPNDPRSSVELDQAFISWYKINTKVIIDYNKLDTKRNEYKRIFIFEPVLTRESRTDVGVSMNELNAGQNLQLENVKKRINDLKIYKEYYYMFTGKNDQVIDLNLRFDEAFVLTSPYYGEGSFADQAAMATATSLTEDEASENVQDKAPVVEKQKKESKKQGILAGLTDLKNKFDEQRKGYEFSNILGQFGEYVGFTDAEIKEIENDINGTKAQQLAESLADEQISSALASNELVKKVTAPQEGSPTDGDEFDDDLSYNDKGYIDFLYSSELIKGLEGDGSDQDAIRDEQIAKNVVLANVRNKTAVKSVEPGDKTTNAPGERGSFRPSMFSHLMDAHSNKTKSTLEINMTVRGDPWWIGNNNLYDDAVGSINENTSINVKPEKHLTTNLFGMSYDDSDTDFLLVLESPRKLDFNIDDEDQNTGLYDFSGINYTMSGVYQCLKTTLNFSNGLFTCDLHAKKNNAYEMSMLEQIKQEINTQFEERRGDVAREGVIDEVLNSNIGPDGVPLS